MDRLVSICADFDLFWVQYTWFYFNFDMLIISSLKILIYIFFYLQCINDWHQAVGGIWQDILGEHSFWFMSPLSLGVGKAA